MRVILPPPKPVISSNERHKIVEFLLKTNAYLATLL